MRECPVCTALSPNSHTYVCPARRGFGTNISRISMDDAALPQHVWLLQSLECSQYSISRGSSHAQRMDKKAPWSRQGIPEAS